MTPRVLLIKARMPTQNEVIDACKAHFSVYAKLKARWGHVVKALARSQDFKTLIDEAGPWHWEFEIGLPAKGKRPDPDGLLSGAMKVIFDALQEAELLENDGWNQVASITSTFVTSTDPFIRVTVR